MSLNTITHQFLLVRHQIIEIEFKALIKDAVANIAIMQTESEYSVRWINLL